MRSLPVLALLLLLAAIGLTGGDSAQAEGDDFAYIGSKKCKMCHLKQYKSWEATKMAQTFEVLRPGERAEAKKEAGLDPDKDYTTDEECVRCHVTGYGKTGGFTDIGATPTLAGVGCEICHGPGGTYCEKPYMTLKNKEYKKAELVAVGMVDTVSSEQCAGCHNSESPFAKGEFDFETRKAEGTHENFPMKYEH